MPTTMAPVYKQKFKEEWKKDSKLQGWLEGKDGGDEARCNVCKKTFHPHLADLRKHASSQIHKKAMVGARKQRTLFQTDGFKSNPKVLTAQMKEKSFELTMALYAAVHSTFQSMDQLCEIIQKKFGPTSLKLHQTKVSALIRKVLGPHFKDELKRDLKNAPFSLLVDESTDHSSVRLVAVAIRYYSSSLNTIVSTYLDMEELPHGDALSLEAAIRAIMERLV